MNTENSTDQFFKSTVLGHPSGLFVLFFTEMWERFSFYGMRALLVMFFTSTALEGGWDWTREQAMALFGSYVGLVYLSTMMGGYFADKKIGYRWAVVIGALLMTLGHGSMALESPFFIYSGLILLVFGNGFFKPNMTSIVSEMYKDRPEKKDGAYTIFYMGVNSGAFFGIVLCGYLGEQVGWNWGFGLAGVFMLFGLIQFWLSQDIFGDIGLKPVKKEVMLTDENNDKLNPFPVWQIALIGLMTTLGLAWIIFEPAKIITNGALDIFNFEVFGLSGNNFTILLAILLFLFLLFYRLSNYSQITKEKMIAVSFFAFLTIFFWAIFEQSPGTLTIFADDYTNRVLVGNAGMIFKFVNAAIVLVPLGIITWVLLLLFKQTFAKYSVANIVLSMSFVIIWGIAFWMLKNQFSEDSLEVPASWFSSLNSLYIIALAPLFSKWWESKYNPSANMKYALGMVFLAIGMITVAIGANGIAPGAKTASVSMIYLILVYLFVTMAELCISPVGLSYVSKLVPARMIAMMFGIWYLAVAIGMKGAAKFGENIDKIADEKGLSYFFWMLAIVSLIVAALSFVMSPIIKKLMHGVR
ncbi:proton-dependent oligopeptide transporter, POT family [Flavobacterium swingsii]|jgi:POT family proton-dependent oligopeptide transporter|uniref:Proton-dependent oligopeptide transporter, POT family n=1 Tax=Flavobacterium swingsii TaxID=498292 RepID=A0A1I0YCU3_9FLAO|nr:peptide MFS transporter [Flavobacterium swingsii]SFB11134.1 proton-dependent oligopeptide transporter, POT family [Flavobacterium swingsii]